MNNKVVADLLEELIHELKQNDELFFTDIDNERIAYVEGVIKKLREGENEELTENEAIKREVMRELYD